MKIILWLLRIIPAFILMQTVIFYKFPGNPESIELFTKLSDFLNGAVSESVIRFGTGIAEIIATILLLIPKTSKLGAILIVLIMLGAVMSHILVLGYNSVFVMALITLGCSAAYLALAPKK